VVWRQAEVSGGSSVSAPARGGLKVSVREADVHKVERSNVEERCDAVVEEVGDLLEAGLDPARVRVEIRKSVRVK